MTDKHQQSEMVFGDPLERKEGKSAEQVVDEMIKQATQGDLSSDEEYISAEEEEDDDKENSEVLKSMKEQTIPGSEFPVSQDENQHGVSSYEEVEKNVRKESEKDDEVEKNDMDGKTEDNKNEEGKQVDEDDNVKNDERNADIDKMKEREEEENCLSEEEKMERRDNSQKLKDAGNVAFRDGKYDEAITEYTKALDICPLTFHKERSIMFANRSACEMKKEAYENAISDSTSAIDLHPQYIKAILRRAELYEKTEKLDEALKDYEAVVKLDPGHDMAKFACMRLQQAINERNEKLKTEMMGKLKDLGNLVLRPFGLSTNNFQLQQDPGTGSYSVQFQQNPPGNGS